MISTSTLSDRRGLWAFALGVVAVTVGVLLHAPMFLMGRHNHFILAGMPANLCVESHLRDATENGFDVHVVSDGTAGPGRAATDAAQVNFGLLATSVLTTDAVLEQLAVAA